MAVRTFTAPTPILSSVAAFPIKMPIQGDAHGSSQASKSSEKSASDAVNQFGEEAKNPLGSQQPTTQPGITYSHQDKLPTLPIPDLEATLKKYIDTLKPLQSHKEARDTANAVEEFLKGDGPELQEKLRKYAEGRSSYIEQFCKHCLFLI